jgi:hypothetical protein
MYIDDDFRDMHIDWRTCAESNCRVLEPDSVKVLSASQITQSKFPYPHDHDLHGRWDNITSIEANHVHFFLLEKSPQFSYESPDFRSTLTLNLIEVAQLSTTKQDCCEGFRSLGRELKHCRTSPGQNWETMAP